jgi:hypothetical protein
MSVNRPFRSFVCLFAAALAPTLRADPKDDAQAAIAGLREASGFSWTTTARQNVREYPDYKRPDDLGEPATIVEVEGKSGAGGWLEVTLPPSKATGEVPVRALIKSSVEAVADTPLGWMTRQEMRDSPRRGESAKVEDKTVRLARFFTAATKATNVESPLDDLMGLLSDIQTYEETTGGVVGRLRPIAAAMLQERSGNSGSAGDTTGTVLFQIRDGVLRAYAVKLVTEIPRRDREPIKSITRWATSFSAIGATSVSPPAEVVRKFEKMKEE